MTRKVENRLLVEDLPDVAVQLGLSGHTIAGGVNPIHRKVISRVEAALEARRLGLFGRH